MKKQKEDFGEKLFYHLATYGWAYLVIMVAIGSLWYFGVFSDNQYCKYNLDECVCRDELNDICSLSEEEWFRKTGVSYPIVCEDYVCKDFRRLTSQELIEKSCNDNPREDEDCDWLYLVMIAEIKDCELNKGIANFLFCNKEELHNLKTAWRAKECEI